MSKIIEIKIKDQTNIYQELVKSLYPYRKKKAGTVLFIVEGAKNKPRIALKYPGRKLRMRVSKVKRQNFAPWANLYDFEVVVYKGGKITEGNNFTFSKLFEDFSVYKRNNKDFWIMIEELYYKNTISKEPPKLKGIDPKLFLLVLKWIWIQEDLNYRLGWGEVQSPERYILETRTGARTSEGAGRAKFFAALVLLNYGFSFEDIKKIIPQY